MIICIYFCLSRSCLLQQMVMLICLSCHLHLLLPAAASVLRIHILLVIPTQPTLQTDPIILNSFKRVHLWTRVLQVPWALVEDHVTCLEYPKCPIQ